MFLPMPVVTQTILTEAGIIMYFPKVITKVIHKLIKYRKKLKIKNLSKSLVN